MARRLPEPPGSPGREGSPQPGEERGPFGVSATRPPTRNPKPETRNSLVLVLLLLALTPALTAADEPLAARIWRVLALQDYNTLVVVVGTSLLGLAAGLVGTYLFLQKRALLGDALAHATLPGVAGAFLLAVALGWDGKQLPLLLGGAVITGLIGVALVQLISRTTRVGDDAAMAIVLATFFGMGIAGMQCLAGLPGIDVAGLNHFLIGHTASMLFGDAVVLAITAAAVLLAVALLRKEFALLVFDRQQAAAQGWPVQRLDALLLVLVTAVVVVGLQAVGAILMLALLVIPPAAARFWTDRLGVMLVISGAIGMFSGYLGCVPSALVAELPAGPSIVLVAATAFVASMVFGSRRGILVALHHRRRARHHVRRQLLLRRLHVQGGPEDSGGESRPDLPGLRLLRREGLVDGEGRLTAPGRLAAERVQRNHQLWRIFLLTHAETAATRLDRELPALDDELPADLVRELEAAHRSEFGSAVQARSS